MSTLAAFDHCTRRVVLELHEFEVSWNQANSVEICRPDNVTHRPTLIVVSDGTVDRFVLPDIEFRLIAEHGGERGLRIEIDCKHAKARQREVLGEIESCRRLRRPALKVGNGDDLKFFAFAASRKELKPLSRTCLSG